MDILQNVIAGARLGAVQQPEGEIERSHSVPRPFIVQRGHGSLTRTPDRRVATAAIPKLRRIFSTISDFIR